MSEAVAIVVGSFVLVTATAFVVAHYRREQMRRKLLGRLAYHRDAYGLGSARRDQGRGQYRRINILTRSPGGRHCLPGCSIAGRSLTLFHWRSICPS